MAVSSLPTPLLASVIITNIQRLMRRQGSNSITHIRQVLDPRQVAPRPGARAPRSTPTRTIVPRQAKTITIRPEIRRACFRVVRLARLPPLTPGVQIKIPSTRQSPPLRGAPCSRWLQCKQNSSSKPSSATTPTDSTWSAPRTIAWSSRCSTSL